MNRTVALLSGLCLALCSCGENPPPATQPAGPRIVSFSPAMTAMLFDMGLGDRVVGVTAFCALPEGQRRPIVGDHQNVNVEMILSLRPDVVLVQQNIAAFETVRSELPDVRLEHFDIETLDDIAAALERLGRLADDEATGVRKREQFQGQLDAVRRRVAGKPRPRVLFLAGVDPLIVAGRDSFIHQIVELAGGQDLSQGHPRWGRIDPESIIRDRPEVIFCQVLSDQPGRAEEARQFLLGLEGTPASANGRVFVLTDNRWTIPSAAMAELAGELAGMIHPSFGQGQVQP